MTTTYTRDDITATAIAMIDKAEAWLIVMEAIDAEIAMAKAKRAEAEERLRNGVNRDVQRLGLYASMAEDRVIAALCRVQEAGTLKGQKRC